MDNVRHAHWVKANHQTRMPKRWISFDTESRRVKVKNGEIQEWSMGTAVRWRRGLKSGKNVERAVFRDPLDLWKWVASYCRSGERTICIAHNLGYDVRISAALRYLPMLGFRLEWCNLDRNVSSMTWRSDMGSLVFCDLYTWLPMPLSKVASLIGTEKLRMPADTASVEEWERYCMRDAEIVAIAMDELCDYVESEELGNWQPTGAGMAYSTWRHKFMDHKVLVHDDEKVLSYERMAMHTGRAEAWRHGLLEGGPWYEVDMRNAYTRVAAESDLPIRLHYATGALSQRQYETLSERFRVLCYVDVCTDVPVVPTPHNGRTVWPVGRFSSWLWDVEVNELLGCGADIKIRKAVVYTRGPVLSAWGKWVLSVIHGSGDDIPGTAKAWAKHCGRALIGRLGLRSPQWESYGSNPTGEVGISWDVNWETKQVSRMMHVGGDTFIETSRREGRDSLPQITSWIMSECRVRLWWGMDAAGFDNIAHVDTDCVIVNRQGLARMREAYGPGFASIWQVKGQWGSVEVTGPRNLRTGRERRLSGVPTRAEKQADGTFKGELWHGLAADMAAGRHDRVTITDATWTVAANDPRRIDSDRGPTLTDAIRLG